MVTISVKVSIGKSKKQIPYTFLKEDFIRIEDDILVLKSDKRKLRLSYQMIQKVVLELNNFKFISNEKQSN